LPLTKGATIKFELKLYNGFFCLKLTICDEKHLTSGVKIVIFLRLRCGSLAVLSLFYLLGAVIAKNVI